MPILYKYTWLCVYNTVNVPRRGKHSNLNELKSLWPVHDAANFDGAKVKH